jgi:hypothetical protein
VHLIQILLPLYDNAGRALPKERFATVARELSERFGGLTAYTRAPAKGIWKSPGGKREQDEIVIYEVMVARREKRWWAAYRRSLEREFRQQEVVIRAQIVEKL